jgi:hypothetical protein
LKYGDLYPDISLLAAECVTSGPNAADLRLWNHIYRACRNEFKRLAAIKQQDRTPYHERLGAAWLLAAWKYANYSQRNTLLSEIPTHLDAGSPIRIQALPMLISAGKSISEWVSAKPGLAWESALAAEYLRSLQEGEDRAVGVALSLTTPAKRLAPQRYTILPRAVPLIDILGTSASEKLSKFATNSMKNLKKNPARLRDHRTESIIEHWTP